ncbi:phosphorylase [Halonotius terrestris]|uniref:Phosphorylase n=1 Tax=Halonotius terrestris TaxID=2487750 RepID=A0A8J8PA42_9EURY|nr:phosphorylase [Halonotius terrestris]TQQ83833.1 phosphorylase [Halonotius terrestris]
MRLGGKASLASRLDRSHDAHPAVVVLPAFTDAEYTGDASEVEPWLDRYDFDSLDVAGIDHPVRHAPNDGVVLAPTGIGKSAAATTVSALAAGDAVALDDATIITVGIAGVAPAAGTLGSVFVADRVVDGDIKLRIGETTRRMQWLVDDYVWELDSDRRDRAVAAASDVELADSDDAQSIRDHYDDDRSPKVDTGPTICGDEVYHGTAAAEQVEALCRTYGIDGIATTEMEDAGTVTALDRFGLLDQYVSIRAAANFDREPAGGDPEASISRDVFSLGVENAVRVGHAVAEEFSD